MDDQALQDRLLVDRHVAFSTDGGPGMRHPRATGTYAKLIEDYVVRDRKLNGRGIGWIDAHLLASALVGRLKLWTADSPLATVAAEGAIAQHTADDEALVD